MKRPQRHVILLFILGLQLGAAAIGGPPWDPEDTDGDGLSDEWEIHYFSNIHTQNGVDDADSDGANNLAEFLAGTDPSRDGT